MNDSLLLWAFNVLLQVTCLSSIGLAIALVFRRHATAKYWVLGSALLLMLLSPLIAAVVQGFGRSFISFEVHTSMTSATGTKAEALAHVLPHTETPYSKASVTGAVRATTEVMTDVTVVGSADATVSDDMELGLAPKPQWSPSVSPSRPFVTPRRSADWTATNAYASIESAARPP